jgi:putative hemolysin
MGSIGTEVLIILLLLLANGVFAMAEISVVSSRKARLQERAEDGDSRAAAALRLAEHPDEFLSTVQVGITLIGILAGAFGGATLSATVAESLNRVPALAPYAAPLSVALVVAAITFLSVVIGELVPKRLALTAPERVAMLVAAPMKFLSRVAKPVVWLLTATAGLILRMLRVNASNEPSVTQAEIEVMLEQGAQAGVLTELESEVAASVFRLADRRVGALMTRRMDVEWLDADANEEKLLEALLARGHARYPVCEGSFENVIGIVESQRLLAACLAGEELDLRRHLTPPLYVPETLSAVNLLALYHENDQRMAIVMDEYGDTQGVITLRDVLEVVAGDITEASTEEPPRAFRREDGTWLLDGMLSTDDFRELFNVDDLPGEDDNLYETLGGFVMAHLGRIPAVGDIFEWNDFRFEVMDMDGRRVDKVLVTPADGTRTGD